MSTRTIATNPVHNDFLHQMKSFFFSLRLSNKAILVADFVLCAALIFIAVCTIGNMKFLSYQIGDQRVHVRASDSQLQSAVSRAVADYKLKIQYPDGTVKSFTAANAGLTLNSSATLNTLHRKEPVMNHIMWWKPIRADLVFDTNATKLADFVTQNATIMTSKATDASIKVSNGSIALTKAKLGKGYGLANAQFAIESQIDALNAQPLVLTEQSVNPTVSDAQLTAVVDNINKIKKEQISIKIGDKTVTPSSKDIASWLSIKSNKNKTGVSVVVNGATVHNYFTNLVYTYSQVKRDQVTVTLASGQSNVASQGQNGIYISGQGAAEGAVLKNLLAGNNFSTKLTSSSNAYSAITAADWPKWIEENLSTQRMYIYENGKTIRTFLTSSGKPSTPTPTGTFFIKEKLTLQTMIGADYVQPDVPWINYFDNRGDAIHGNYWRPASVFGNYGTSHGCIGLQVSDAEWVYGWAPIGTPIVIHY